MHAPQVLYAFPFSCSLAVKWVLALHDVPVTVHTVRRGPGRRVTSPELSTVNPKRKVPTIVTADGTVHTEVIAILHALDESLHTRTQPERRAHLEWLCFVATELHQQVVGPVFDPDTPPVTIEDAGHRLLPPVLALVEEVLASDGRLTAEKAPSPADAYLLWALLLVRQQWPAQTDTPGIRDFMRWMLGHAAIRQALAAEQAALLEVTAP